jgi:hypothetical protein
MLTSPTVLKAQLKIRLLSIASLLFRTTPNSAYVSMATPARLALTDFQHVELTDVSQSRSLPAGYVFGSKLILMLAEWICRILGKAAGDQTAMPRIRWINWT